MTQLDYDEANAEYKGRVLDGIKSHFPVVRPGSGRSLELESVRVDDEDRHPDDFGSQKDVKVSGRSWVAPVKGVLALKDKDGGVIQRTEMTLADVPLMTRRHSYIVDGKEWQMKNQWRLMPGVYTRRKGGKGLVESSFNVPNKRSFDITLDPAKKLLTMSRGKSKNIHVYPLMKAMGVSDDELESKWGKDVLSANKNARGSDGALRKFFKVDNGERKASTATTGEMAKYFRDTMAESVLRPEVTERTLGTKATRVNGDVLLRATKRIMDVQRGAPEDDRDSLEFKDLRTAGDFVYERLTAPATAQRMRTKISRNIDKKDVDIRRIIKKEMLNDSVISSIKGKGEGATSMGNTAEQVNPLEMLGKSMETTLRGPGGIQEARALDKMIGAKMVNPTHMGFLDPVKTPEKDDTGISLRMPMGVRKKGNTPVIRLFNVKSGQLESMDPRKFSKSVVAMPDQVDWKGGKPVFASKAVRASKRGNDLGDVPTSEVTHVIQNPSQLFTTTTNLVPFLSSNSGNRVTYAGQHLEQAVSLVDREAPLIQVATGQDADSVASWERVLGKSTSHLSPAEGTVTKVTADEVEIRDAKGKRHKMGLYNNFPTNHKKGQLHSTLREGVKVGTKVGAGQHLADTNFTKNGELALGTNLKAAYIPWKGYNFEDGIVVSESAAKKLTSGHLHKPNTVVAEGTKTSLTDFKNRHQGVFTKTQLGKVDDNGVVRVGQKVSPGDPLLVSDKSAYTPGQLKGHALRKALIGEHVDTSLRWEGEQAGVVRGIHRKRTSRGDTEVTVHVETQEPLQEGDKLSGRYGNKGVVTKIVPDAKMPQTTDGKHIQIALNPTGVPGRMNVGQVLETAASKVARKTGKPYIVPSFTRGSALARVKADLKKHGLQDQEELIDPETGLSMGKALVGEQHILKLHHQIAGKTAARGGMQLGEMDDREMYDLNLTPAQGGKTSGQSAGPLGLYALLTHGASANIREMQTFKSEGVDTSPNENARRQTQHRAVWDAIQEGYRPPVPKSTYAFAKFTDMLKGAGVNVEKKGHNLQLSPLTDAQTLAMSKGRLPKPEYLTESKVDATTGNLKPRKGGLFDERLTGGHGGKNWTHIELPEPIPSPVFEEPIKKLLDLKEAEFSGLANGTRGWKNGKLVDVDTDGAVTGGIAIKGMLDKIDVQKELKKVEGQLAEAHIASSHITSGKPSSSAKTTVKVKGRSRSVDVDKLLKKAKYLRALDQTGMKPSEAYTTKVVPVLPPAMRTPTMLPDGSVQWRDVNELYSKLGQQTSRWDPKNVARRLPSHMAEARSGIYDSVAAIQVGHSAKNAPTSDRGLLQQIAGSQPKHGYFQKALMNRKQDLTMRSTITVNPSLGLDEVGLPKGEAIRMYRPFVVAELKKMGAAPTAADARKIMERKEPVMWKALDRVVKERPVLLKRDPALHKHSIQGFQPRVVAGKSIQIHPLVTSGYNADFDGDAMSAYVPVSREAVEEAKKMMPTNNLYNNATGEVTYVPTLESALGIYKLSRPGKSTSRKFKSQADAIKAVQGGKLGVTDMATIAGAKTSVGRALIASALPTPMKAKLLTSDKPIDGKELKSVFTDLAKNHRQEYGDVADRLKDLGNYATSGAVPIRNTSAGAPDIIRASEKPGGGRQYVPVPVHSLSLDDFTPDEQTRRKHLRKAEATVRAVRRTRLSEADKVTQEVDAWSTASEGMLKEHMDKMEKKPTNLALMSMAGVKPSKDQYRQMILAPMVMTDGAGRPVRTPVTGSYAEGLGVADYWTQMHGARSGALKKAQEVKDPGYLSKLLIQSTMDVGVTADDCATDNGISLSVNDASVHDRVLAQDFKARKTFIPKGTLLTPQDVGKMRAANKRANVLVRSTLKCEHGSGVCQKCAGASPEGGFYQMGTNVGVGASQALGERAVQLSLKAFHSGGSKSAGGGGTVLNMFDRIDQLTGLPENVPDTATLSTRSGTIDRVERDKFGTNIWVGGKAHHVGKDRGGRDLIQEEAGADKANPDYRPWQPPKKGMKVAAGQPLSDPNRTTVNPHHLYRATGNMEKVKSHLTDELYRVYKNAGVRRQHVETVVHSMGRLTKVQDPGDAADLLKGDYHNAQKLKAMNKELQKAGKKVVQHSPVLRGVKMFPQNLQEDWMAKLMHEQLTKNVKHSAAINSSSNLHGRHPIPGIAFGAEFGLTSKDSQRLGREHLADVPEFNY